MTLPPPPPAAPCCRRCLRRRSSYPVGLPQRPLNQHLEEVRLCQVAGQRRHLALRQGCQYLRRVALRLHRLPRLQLVQQQVQQVGFCGRGGEVEEGRLMEATWFLLSQMPTLDTSFWQPASRCCQLPVTPAGIRLHVPAARRASSGGTHPTATAGGWWTGRRAARPPPPAAPAPLRWRWCPHAPPAAPAAAAASEGIA